MTLSCWEGDSEDQRFRENPSQLCSLEKQRAFIVPIVRGNVGLDKESPLQFMAAPPTPFQFSAQERLLTISDAKFILCFGGHDFSSRQRGRNPLVNKVRQSH